MSMEKVWVVSRVGLMGFGGFGDIVAMVRSESCGSGDSLGRDVHSTNMLMTF